MQWAMLNLLPASCQRGLQGECPGNPRNSEVMGWQSKVCLLLSERIEVLWRRELP